MSVDNNLTLSQELEAFSCNVRDDYFESSGSRKEWENRFTITKNKISTALKTVLQDLDQSKRALDEKLAENLSKDSNSETVQSKDSNSETVQTLVTRYENKCKNLVSAFSNHSKSNPSATAGSLGLSAPAVVSQLDKGFFYHFLHLNRSFKTALKTTFIFRAVSRVYAKFGKNCISENEKKNDVIKTYRQIQCKIEDANRMLSVYQSKVKNHLLEKNSSRARTSFLTSRFVHLNGSYNPYYHAYPNISSMIGCLGPVSSFIAQVSEVTQEPRLDDTNKAKSLTFVKEAEASENSPSNDGHSQNRSREAIERLTSTNAAVSTIPLDVESPLLKPSKNEALLKSFFSGISGVAELIHAVPDDLDVEVKDNQLVLKASAGLELNFDKTMVLDKETFLALNRNEDSKTGQYRLEDLKYFGSIGSKTWSKLLSKFSSAISIKSMTIVRNGNKFKLSSDPEFPIDSLEFAENGKIKVTCSVGTGWATISVSGTYNVVDLLTLYDYLNITICG